MYTCEVDLTNSQYQPENEGQKVKGKNPVLFEPFSSAPVQTAHTILPDYFP